LSAAVQASLLILVRVVALGGLIYYGLRLASSQPPHGLTAGIAFGLVSVLAIGLFTCAMGIAFERWFGERSVLAVALTLGLGAALLLGTVYLYFLPRFEQRLIQVEDQGWFSIASYKRSQGQKVRRGTILGILLLAGCGIWTLMHHNTLPAGDWKVGLPFTAAQTFTLLPTARYSIPLLLAFGAFWLASRVATYPTF